MYFTEPQKIKKTTQFLYILEQILFILLIFLLNVQDPEQYHLFLNRTISRNKLLTNKQISFS